MMREEIHREWSLVKNLKRKEQENPGKKKDDIDGLEDKRAELCYKMAWNLWDWIFLVVVILASILYYGHWLNGHFKRRGVKSIESTIPFFGHMWNIFLGKEHFIEAVYKTYNKHSDEKYVGFYAFRNKIVILRDLELIKQIGVKEFDNFIDHRIFMDEEADPLFGKNLFFLRGQKWRDMRVSMSPAYTGSKMKNMFPMIVECAQQSVLYFQRKAKESPAKDVGYVEVEMKDIFTRYTNDVIASTAFGMKVNSLEEQSNKFYLMGKKATDFSGVQFLKFLGYGSIPKVMKFFKIPLFSPPVASFFRNLVHDTMATREAGQVNRPDMIQLLMMARQGSLKHEGEPSVADDTGFSTINKAPIRQDAAKREWTNDDLTAQAMAFLLAGFDTSSSLLCFISYELSLNPDIQVRLQEEIDAVLANTDGNLDYSELMKMKYIDMVVSETLRKWPPDGHLDRLCATSFTLPPPNSSSQTKYHLKKGDDVWIPTYSIHHDARYYPDPEKFDPERFSDDNKTSLTPFTFIPFGIGPRFCIGARFAVLEAKVVIFHILAHFNIVTTPTTTIPLKLARNTFIMHSENGFWLGLQPRNKN